MTDPSRPNDSLRLPEGFELIAQDSHLGPLMLRSLDRIEQRLAESVHSADRIADVTARHLLDAELLALLPADAALINAGRGSLIDETALLARLDAGLLRFVLLDVFAEEPLPESHPFWNHPRVILTPHVAADTVPEEAARQIASGSVDKAAIWGINVDDEYHEEVAKS